MFLHKGHADVPPKWIITQKSNSVSLSTVGYVSVEDSVTGISKLLTLRQDIVIYKVHTEKQTIQLQRWSQKYARGFN